jgi:hypothetical protein
LLIISSALTIADTRKGFAVTGLVSGTFIIVRPQPHLQRLKCCTKSAKRPTLSELYRPVELCCCWPSGCSTACTRCETR